MADSDQDRQLPATQRKLQKARADGQVPRSRDLGHFAGLGGGVAVLVAYTPELTALLQRLLAQGLRFDASQINRPAAMGEQLTALAWQMLAVLLPMGAVAVVLALAAGVLCGGWNFTLKPLHPKFDKLNLLAGLGRVFGTGQLGDTLKSCLLALLLGGVGLLFLNQQWLSFAQLLSMPLPAALASGGEKLQSGLLLVGLVLATFALVDVPLQRLLHLRRLRMSAQEIKKEFKEQEGSAEVKQKMRANMRNAANKRMLAAVPTADLVLMNPSHYAVALKYIEGGSGAPRVVAKGADLMALRIRDAAVAAGVPVLQAPPLARALFAHCELEQEIPARLFGAVAQVLAWVFQLRDAMAAGRQHSAPAPVPEVPADLDPLNKPTPATGPAK